MLPLRVPPGAPGVPLETDASAEETTNVQEQEYDVEAPDEPAVDLVYVPSDFSSINGDVSERHSSSEGSDHSGHSSGSADSELQLALAASRAEAEMSNIVVPGGSTEDVNDLPMQRRRCDRPRACLRGIAILVLALAHIFVMGSKWASTKRLTSIRIGAATAFSMFSIFSYMGRYYRHACPLSKHASRYMLFWTIWLLLSATSAVLWRLLRCTAEDPEAWPELFDDAPMSFERFSKLVCWMPRQAWANHVGRGLLITATLVARVVVLGAQAALTAKIAQGKSRVLNRKVGQAFNVVSRGAHAAIAIHIGWD